MIKKKTIFEEDREREIKAKEDGKFIQAKAFTIYNRASLLKNLAQKFKEEEDTTYTQEEKVYFVEEIEKMLGEIKSNFEEILNKK